MIISKQNTDNSNIFRAELLNYPHTLVVIIVKQHKYVPKFEADNNMVVYLKDELYSKEVENQLGNSRVFFSNTLDIRKNLVNTVNTFSDKIRQNLLKNTEQAINDTAKYASYVYDELEMANKVEFIVISATEDYPDVMILLNPTIPESQEKTQIKKILCYPKKV